METGSCSSPATWILFWQVKNIHRCPAIRAIAQPSWEAGAHHLKMSCLQTHAISCGKAWSQGIPRAVRATADAFLRLQKCRGIITCRHCPMARRDSLPWAIQMRQSSGPHSRNSWKATLPITAMTASILPASQYSSART